MSNFLAIATVTAALRTAINNAILDNATLSQVNVYTERPRTVKPDDGKGLFVYLYQAMPNAALRGQDLPTRRAEGSMIQRPQAALNLYYMLSFFGDEAALEPQRLLGIVVQELHSRPVLTRSAIRAAIQSNPSLGASDLEDAIERVRLTPVTLNLEDMSKLWSVYIQAPYLLSVCYEASVVLIEDETRPQPALPVRESGIYNVLFKQPVVDSAEAAGGGAEPIVMGTLVRIRGANLQGRITRVRMGDQEGKPSLVSDEQVALAMAEPPFGSGTLRAGIIALQVVHYEELGPDLHRFPVGESNAVPLVFRPTLTQPPTFVGAPRRVRVSVRPIVGSRQQVSIHLLPTPLGKAISYPAARRAADTTSFDIPIPDAPAGTYLVRLRVDGADSPLTVDDNPASATYGQYVGPKVVLP